MKTEIQGKKKKTKILFLCIPPNYPIYTSDFYLLLRIILITFLLVRAREKEGEDGAYCDVVHFITGPSKEP